MRTWLWIWFWCWNLGLEEATWDSTDSLPACLRGCKHRKYNNGSVSATTTPTPTHFSPSSWFVYLLVCLSKEAIYVQNNSSVMQISFIFRKHQSKKIEETHERRNNSRATLS